MPLDYINTEYRIEFGRLKQDLNDMLHHLERVERATKDAGDTTTREFNQAAKAVDRVGDELDQVGRKAKNNLDNGIGKGIAQVGKAFVAFAIADKIAQIGGAMTSAAAQTEKFRTTLRVALGGSDLAAGKALADLREFAAKTPFQLAEVTEGYIKLVNRGIKPTQAELTAFGDLAASQGKSLDQVIEATLDAQTGENERLKELGIIARKNGDEVALSFKGVTQTVKATPEAIKDAIVSFGQMDGVLGGMAAQSQTLGGAISNFEDKLAAAAAGGGSAFSGTMMGLINIGGEMLDIFTDLTTSQTPLTDSLRLTNVELNASFNALQNGNLPAEQRKILIDQINQRYGQYLPNLLTEKSSLEDIKKAQDGANESLQRKILIMAREESLTAIYKEQAEQHSKLVDLQVRLAQAQDRGVLTNLGKSITNLRAETEAGIQNEILFANAELKKLGREAEALEKGFENRFKELGITSEETKEVLDELQGPPPPPPPTPPGPTAAQLAAIDKQKQANDQLAELEKKYRDELYLATIEDAYKRQEEELRIEKEGEIAKIEAREYASKDARKAAIDAVEKAYEQQGKDLQTKRDQDIANERLKIEKDLQKSRREAQDATEAARIEAMEDGLDKEVAKAQFAIDQKIRAYEDEIAAYKEQYKEKPEVAAQFEADVREKIKAAVTDFNTELQDINDKHNDEINKANQKAYDEDVENRKKAEEEKKRVMAELSKFAEQIGREILTAAYASADQQRQRELEDLEKQKEAKVISEADYLKEKERIERAQFEADRKRKKAEIAIETAKNIAEAFPNPVLIGAALVLGLVQTAIVDRQTYNKGTTLVPGVGDSDTVPAMLTPGEAVIRKKVNMKHHDVIKALHADRFEQWVDTQVEKRILDALDARPGRGGGTGMADSIHNSLRLHGAFSDRNIVKALGQPTDLSDKTIRKLGREIRGKGGRRRPTGI